MNGALPADLPETLDRVHLEVRETFRQRDISRYSSYLAADLVYVRPGGRTMPRERLLRSIRAQFRKLIAFDSTFERASLAVIDGNAVEVGTQRAVITMRLLFLFAITWSVERTARYSWRRNPRVGWELFRVELMEERIQRKSIGRRG